MATSTGKAARRMYGTKAAAKKARKRSGKNFDDSPADKAQYRELKRQRRESLRKRKRS